MAYSNPSPVMPISDPNKRPLPSPTFRSRPASVVLPPTSMNGPPIVQGAIPAGFHMLNMASNVVPTSFPNSGPIYGVAPQPPTRTPRPASFHGFQGWNGLPQNIPPVSPINAPMSPFPGFPANVMPNPPPAPLLANTASSSDPNKRPLPPPPPAGSSRRALPSSPSLPTVPPVYNLPRSMMGSNTQSLPSISTSVPSSVVTGLPTKGSSPTKRSLPVAPGGGGIAPGSIIMPPTQSQVPPKSTTLPSQSAALPASSSQSASSPLPLPARSSTTPISTSSSPAPTSAPSSYASARSTFTASPPPTGRPQSTVSDAGGEDKRPLWKRMAAQHTGSRPQSVFGHRARNSVDEGTSGSGGSATTITGSTSGSGSNGSMVNAASSTQRGSSPLNYTATEARKQQSQTQATSWNPSPVSPPLVPNRPSLPSPPGSSNAVKVSEQQPPPGQPHPVSALPPTRQNLEHPLPRPPSKPSPVTLQSQREVRFSRPPEIVGPSSPPTNSASPPRAVAASPPRASAMKSQTKAAVNIAPKSKSEMISTSPPRVPPTTRSSPLPKPQSPIPKTQSQPSPTRQFTAPSSSFISNSPLNGEEGPRVSMALRFASEDVAKQTNKDWAQWALKSSREVVEKPMVIDGSVVGKDSGGRSASTGGVDASAGSPSIGVRDSFDATVGDVGLVLSSSPYAASRRGGARPMPSSAPSPRARIGQSAQHGRVGSEEFPQYRPSYTDSDSEEEGSSSNPRITVSAAVPQINVTQMSPQMNVTPAPVDNGGRSRPRSGSNPAPIVPAINIQEDVPAISITVDEHDSKDAVVAVPVFSFGGVEEEDSPSSSIPTTGKKEKRHKREKSVKEEEDERERARRNAKNRPLPPKIKKNSARCGKCDKSILGRIVSAMGARWHPECFRCTVCETFLEHVSSYEHDDRPYCHLDYHELFAPRCFHCKTPIMEEHFITLDDDVLGKRTYHEQHFFCAECGDPFLAPKQERKTRILPNGMLEVIDQEDEVGFTVYKGHPYCESCHVRLRMPKCKRCKKSIRPGDQAIEAMGGKWCWDCFTCDRCSKPFEDPQFYEHNKKPYCQPCYSIILVNQLG